MFKKIPFSKKKLISYFKQDIAVDLGTANTLVYSPDKGIILNEPSVVTIQKYENERKVLAVGKKAKYMLGRTPGNIIASRPIKDGVIADFEVTQQMLKYFISASTKKNLFIRPRIVISVPYGITQVEKRAVQESALSAGARSVHLIEEPLAAAIGAGLPITEAAGNLIVDIGGGTTGVAIISMGGIVICESIKVGGDKFDEAIINYIRRHFNLLIGERTAENIKINLGTAFCIENENKHFAVKGRDLVTGNPKTINLNRFQINKALSEPLEQIIGAIRLALEKTPPELSSDIVDNGIFLTGGGALLHNMDILLKEKTELPVSIAEKPLYCVVLGAGETLNQIDLLNQITVS
ncbi:MAG: rod shape-determining protein [Bdellovibrionales bacterium]|nr:rod shape-determining protein [Bdellovibrionales bacterium]